MSNNKSISVWKNHLQEEIDASYLYKVLSGLEKNDKKKDIYGRLSEVEKKHIKVWRDLLLKHDVKLKDDQPSFKAKSLVWLANQFGVWILSKALMNEEAEEVKSYLSLHKTSTDKETKDIALQLAKDSAGHANSLMDIKGTSEEPWHRSESGGLLRNVVYGFNDGLTANFGLIAGMIGASVAPHIILISGISGMLADALSMGSSGYLAAISEKEVYDHERKMEKEEILLMPELETEELALIYESKGMSREDSANLAGEVMKDPAQALEEKVRVELGIGEANMSPIREGWITGLATAVGALIPVFPFFFLTGATAMWTAFTIAMLAHFGVGAARSFFTGRGIFRSGFDMFVVGFGIAAIGYFIGEFISKLF
ncbi:MAG TPA: VIT1/CCC1 transporter family protein [Ignavibacteriaceae bacterium]|nr:VIT1/CCC1 transporter family protein [Ignavibacteriaceae bacterium]